MPDPLHAVAFVDGQNLYHGSREAFGETYPSYDCLKLAQSVASSRDWILKKVNFYTGVPSATDDVFWNSFWNKKLAHMGRLGVNVFARQLRYQDHEISLPDGTVHRYRRGHEKGIDIRLAVDALREVYEKTCDVLLVFSQDQDLSEMVDEARRIAKAQQRQLTIASAYPVGVGTRNRRGIERTDWIQIDAATYQSCADTRDYYPAV